MPMSKEKIEAIKAITVAYIETVIEEFDWDDTKEYDEAIYDFISGLIDVLSKVETKSDQSAE